MKLNKENLVSSVVDLVAPNMINKETVFGSCIHPPIYQKLRETESGFLLKTTICKVEGSRGPKISPMKTSSYVRVPCNHQSQHSTCTEMICKSNGENLEQLVKARNTRSLELSPEDEVVGNLFIFIISFLAMSLQERTLVMI